MCYLLHVSVYLYNNFKRKCEKNYKLKNPVLNMVTHKGWDCRDYCIECILSVFLPSLFSSTINLGSYFFRRVLIVVFTVSSSLSTLATNYSNSSFKSKKWMKFNQSVMIMLKLETPFIKHHKTSFHYC